MKKADRLVGKLAQATFAGSPCLSECLNDAAEVSNELDHHEKFTRWLIGELIKGELDEEAVMNKLVEFGFAECRDGYISVKVEI